MPTRINGPGTVRNPRYPFIIYKTEMAGAPHAQGIWGGAISTEMSLEGIAAVDFVIALLATFAGAAWTALLGTATGQLPLLGRSSSPISDGRHGQYVFFAGRLRSAGSVHGR